MFGGESSKLNRLKYRFRLLEVSRFAKGRALKIPLDDPIWARLYGPYGLDDVAGTLAELCTDWCDETAKEFFWERLHHQDDLYPVTFAALPWLWEFAPRPPAGTTETLSFFSHVIYCATVPDGAGSDGEGTRGRYRGLSLDVADHHHKWLPADGRLQANDMDTLAGLENWLGRNAGRIADACAAASPADERFEAVYLLEGFAALRGGHNTADAMRAWADQEDFSRIIEHYPPTAADAEAATATRDAPGSRAADLSAFLTRYAAAYRSV